MNPEKIKIEETRESKLESTNQLIAQEKSILQKFQGKAKKIARVLILVTALSAAAEIGLPHLKRVVQEKEEITTEQISKEDSESKYRYYMEMARDEPLEIFNNIKIIKDYPWFLEIIRIAAEKKSWAALAGGEDYLPYLKPEERLGVIKPAAEKATEEESREWEVLAFGNSYLPYLKPEERQEIIKTAAEKDPWAAIFFCHDHLPYLKPEERQEIIKTAAEKRPKVALEYGDCFSYLKPKERQEIIKTAAEKDPWAALAYGHEYLSYLKPEEGREIIEKSAEKDPATAVHKAIDRDDNEIKKILQKSKTLTSKILREIIDSPYESMYSYGAKEKIACLLNEIARHNMTIPTAFAIVNNEERFLETLINIKSQPNHLGEISVSRPIKDLALRKMENINSLHDAPDEIRFKSVENISPQHLYTLMVYGEEEVFTSSFNGLFNRLLARMNKERINSNQLLEKMGYDKFRTFLKMCAGFNRLNEFLQTMNKDSQKFLLEKFVKDIEKEKDSLAQAVAVADTFSVLEDPKILRTFQETIKNEYQRVKEENNREGLTLYGLLAGMFGKKAVINEDWIKEMSEKYQLPNLIEISSKDLFNQEEINVQQYFFYNDKDGRSSFESFLSQYKNKPGWQIEDKKEYICLKSTGGNKKIEIYANKPTSEYEGQEKISEIFKTKGVQPRIIAHRGHSYHAYKTIGKIPPEAKIVSLGSCGGYNNINKLIEKALRAHIISTKGRGTMLINDPLLKMLNDEICSGKDINWPNFWSGLDKRFGNNPDFQDYIPPHKNIGALFLKAYHQHLSLNK